MTSAERKDIVEEPRSISEILDDFEAVAKNFDKGWTAASPTMAALFRRAKRDVEASISRLQAENGKMRTALDYGWKPIETAPSGSAPIWLGHAPSNVRVVGYRHATPNVWGLTWSDRTLGWLPTHWMPIPPPPDLEGLKQETTE